MSGYIGPAPVPQSTQTRQTFTATSGQTSFATVGYVAGGQFIQVYLNGVLLKLTDDYTAANGSDIILTSGAATGDVLEFISFADFTVNNQNFTGGLTVDNDGSTVLTVDRATSDGTIIDLQKSGSSVGIIGVTNGVDPYFASTTNATGGIRIRNSESVHPCSSTGGNNDDDLDLGRSNSRFKDLYLSGGVVFSDAGGSGTSSSNSLDSYEEGTFIPTAQGNTTAGSTTYAVDGRLGYYTKIGNCVHVVIRVQYTALTGTGVFVVENLPFTSSSSTQNLSPLAVIPSALNWTSGTSFVGLVIGNSAKIQFYCLSDNGTAAAQQCVNESASLRISGHYFTDA